MNAEKSPYIFIHKIIIHGLDNSYKAEFKDGINLIWGDMDCGKSSILNLIDYCLGGSNETLAYGEILAKGRVAYLEVDLNGNVVTFERPLLDSSAPVKAYRVPYSSILTTYPALLSADSRKSLPDGWISDFILDALGIPKVSIKESRYRDDADSDRLSFRDLMKLMYLKQTKVGADSLLNHGNPAVFSKNIEVQKFIYNIHDDKLAALNKELQLEAQELRQLQDSEVSISKFLRDVNITTNESDKSEESITSSELTLAELEESSEKLKSDYEFSSAISLEMAREIVQMRSRLSHVKSERLETEKQHKNFANLKNTYQSDLESLNLSKLTRASISNREIINSTLPCPLCSSEISLASPQITDSDIDAEIKSIKNRLSGAQAALEKLWSNGLELLDEENSISRKLSTLTVDFDRFNIENISALLSSIEALERAKVEIKVSIASAKRDLAINNKYSDISKRIQDKNSVIYALKRNIKSVEEGLTGLEDVVAKLSGIFRNYITNSGLQNTNGTYVDEKFIPHFRNISYYNTTSGGVRTITSIGGFVSRMEYLLSNTGNLPTFLMIDTPGQNIGRRGRKDDDSTLSDPALYNNIFKQFLNLVSKAQTDNRKFQIIIVDNDLPPILEEGGNYHLVKRFSKNGGEFEKGLINDY
ncbi:AAA family ATPase [uncultured Pseudomonas sp.]|uniref:AAA family ATPase n=1 Tax=uncultured Pseudomonas sp. TaxID=114707 RepID=UPI0025E9CB2A|nr:AAA family ATPase [uncultured Pseudomonas sp.]